VRGTIAKAAALGVPPFVAFGLSDLIASRLGIPEVLVAVSAFALMFAAIIVAVIKLMVPWVTARANYQARFKREVVSEIFKIVAPDASYAPFASIAEADFDASGLFNPVGSYTSDDRVRGQIGGIPFEAAEVRRKLRTGFREKSTTHTVFHGLFFHLVGNRHLSGTTIVHPAGAGGYQTGQRDDAERRSTGDPEFDDAFRVFGTDEAETATVLTPAMRRGIMALGQRTGRPVFVGFKTNRVYLGIHYNRSLFEPSVVRTTSLETLQLMADQFTLAEDVVRELNLHAQASGDGLTPHAWPADPEPTDPLQSAIASGTMTEQDVWRLAAETADGSVTDRDVAVPRPADTKVDIHHGSDDATISYGLPLSFFVQILASLCFAVVALYALRALDRLPAALGGITDLFDTLAAATGVANLVEGYPLVALGVGGVVSAFLAFMWTTRVRRVVIDRDAVRIYRGLRPFPRRYARPSYERIVQADRAVHVGKTGSTGLLNPSASPILQSTDEARWVAAEMRRALRQMPAAIPPA
jgi:hypothetical protein